MFTLHHNGGCLRRAIGIMVLTFENYNDTIPVVHWIVTV